MHDDYDRSSKWLIQHRGAAILRLAGVNDIESWRPLQADVVQPRQLPDGLLEVHLAHEPTPHLFIVEIATYPEERLYEQVLRDTLLVYLDRRQLPEVMTLILRPRRRGGTAGRHNLASARAWTNLRISWRAVRLWTLSAADLLATDDLGLIPWVLLTRFNAEPAAILQQCRERIDRQAPPEERLNFLAVAQVLTRLRYNDANLLSIFGGHQIMIDSPLIRELVAGQTHKTLLKVLEGRFGTVPEEIAVQLRAIEDESKLMELALYAGACKDMNAFRKRLKG